MDIKNIKFGYNKSRFVIDDISCIFQKGKITSIIGPNGCGKSTLLSVCNKLNKPSGGTIYLDGKNIAEFKRRDFALTAASVYQLNEVSSEVTVRELIAYGRSPHRRMFSLPSEHDEQIIDYAITKTKLSEFANRRVCEMSGGERQRVFLAMALCQEPRILFLDEPTSFLDVYYQLEIMEIIKEVNAEKNVTVVMVLHDINQAVKYSDNIIVMKSGEIIATGDANDVVTVPLIKQVYNVHSQIIKTSENDKFYAIFK